MANIEVIKAKPKAWQKNDGEVRYYVNDWQRIIGLNVDYCKEDWLVEDIKKKVSEAFA